MAGVDTERFIDLVRITKRNTDFAGEGFDPSADPVWNGIRILVVGAGGLGCELLHCLALLGFEDIHVIDMDTIDLSNLNRQFLFRPKDVGHPKSTVAAEFMNKRFPWVKVTSHFCKIQDMDDDFYRAFHIVIMGLDSIPARQWLNQKYAQLATYHVVDGEIALLEATPLIDGGTEGFRGSARHIKFGKTACIECSMYLYPPQQGVPMCTLQNVPRVPEHCVLYVKEKTWKDEAPFGREANGKDAKKLDGDDPDHIVWIMEKAQERQKEFKLNGKIDFQFTQGVVKNVIPAVGFTNAMIAAMCANEAVKMATGLGKLMDNYTFYDGSSNGVASYTQVMYAMDDCEVCQTPSLAKLSKSLTPVQAMDQVLGKHARVVDGSGDPWKEGGDIGIWGTIPTDEGVKRITFALPKSHPLASSYDDIQKISLFETAKAAWVSANMPAEDFVQMGLEVSGGFVGKKLIKFVAVFE